MSFWRSLAVAALALVVLGAAADALYVITARPVHATSGPPASLAKLVTISPPQTVPAVAFTAAAGKRLALAGFKGRFVLINLWARWCAPCVRELPALARLQKAIPRSQLEIVAVNVGRTTEDESLAFLKAHDAATLSTYIDSDHALLRAFNIYALPFSSLIDANGREVARALGSAEWDAPDAIGYLRTLTEQPPKPGSASSQPRT
jgi:thiol-disulfide isomerase/thioredoxin